MHLSAVSFSLNAAILSKRRRSIAVGDFSPVPIKATGLLAFLHVEALS